MNTMAKSSALLPSCAAAVIVLGSVLAMAPAQADGGCLPGDVAGQVPRNARPGDNVCVLPAIAALVQTENANKNDGYAAGAFSVDLSCKPGLVWRGAYDGDGICVTPARRIETWQENAGVGNTGGLEPLPGGPIAEGTGDPESALLAAVNGARLHPEQYPPRGDLTAGEGPNMTPCAQPLGYSWALENTAAAHNSFIATMPANVVSVYPTMHEAASGGLVVDDGGPIERAGYRTWRSEIVAAGFPTAAAAVVFWMQDDAGSDWGHRNAILRCETTDAGAADLVGGPFGHYWTVDLGTH